MNAHVRKTTGPTEERLSKSDGFYVVGDDKQGTKIYHFLDSHLARIYKRFGVSDKSDDGQDQLRREFVALVKYRDHWHYAGLEAKCGSASLDRVQSSGSDMRSAEKFAHHVFAYRSAAKVLGMWNSHVVEHIACLDRPVAECSAYGVAITPYKFRKMLRESAVKLADHWDIR